MITTCTRPDPTIAPRTTTKLHVLVVNSEDSDVDLLSNALQSAGCRVDVEHFERESRNLGGSRQYAAIIVNLMFPDVVAIEAVKCLRRFNAQTAILVLTGKHDFQTRVEALEVGADDYLGGPFSTEQLLDRMMTVIHRKRLEAGRTITIADLAIDSGERLARRGGKQIDLTRREYELLRYLAMHQGEIVSRTEIREHVYKGDGESTSNIVDVYIRYLRKKIELPGRPKLLHTFHGRGYMLGQRGPIIHETGTLANGAPDSSNQRSSYLS